MRQLENGFCGGRPAAMGRRSAGRFCALGAALAGLALSVGTGQLVGQEMAVRQLTLDEAIALARQRNPALQQAQTGLESARFDRLRAWGSFLPDLSLSYGYSNSSTGRLDPTGQGIVATSFTAQIGANYELFSGLRRFSDLKGARLGVVEQNARYRQTEFDMIRLVKQAYFNAVAARELVQVEQDRVQRQEDQLNFVQQQLQLGRATRSDILRSQVDLNSARLALLNAENDARTTTFQLTEVVGSQQRIGPVDEASLMPVPLEYTREQLLDMALLAAPSIATATAATDAAEQAVNSARSAYLPNLTFSGGWAWANTDFPPSNRSWSLSLRGSYPLFNGFQRETQLFRAQATADIARAQEKAAQLALRSDFETAYSTLQSALAGIDLAAQSVELSGESLRVEQERYRLGLATILDLQTAQIALSQSEVDLVNRRFDYQLALAQLEALLGQALREP